MYQEDSPDEMESLVEFPTLPDREQVDRLFSLTYEELRRLAYTIRQDDPGATLNPTSLVHEAWLKLARSREFAHLTPLDFKRIAARAMRQLLVEAARRRKARKRGGDAGFVTLDDSFHQPVTRADDVTLLDTALHEFARLSPRQAQVVEARFFGGFEMPEIAAALGVSEATVNRDWKAAKAWLAREMRRNC
jgi:RNA polymerase sigma factor (TIGR02999 family)